MEHLELSAEQTREVRRRVAAGETKKAIAFHFDLTREQLQRVLGSRKRFFAAPTPTVAQLDKLFSDVIRSRGECELWGYGDVQCSTQLQCSHIYSRGIRAIRWDERNAICACAAHHFWQHERPYSNIKALQEIVGLETLEDLERLAIEAEPRDRRELYRELSARLKEVGS